MKICRIKITKLFGSLNPDIKLTNNIQIIYGKNGTGKTTILKIINSILSGSLNELKTIKFQKISCYFDDKSEVHINKANDNKSLATRRDQFDKKNLFLTFSKEQQVVHTAFIPHVNDVESNFPLDIIDREIRELERISHKLWRNIETSETMTLGDVIDVYSGQFPWLAPVFKSPWYKTFIKAFDVRFIQTQRLITYSGKSERLRYASRESRFSYENTVSKYSVELRNYMRDLLSESVQIGQKLDSTFPNRLLSKTVHYDYNEKIIFKLAEELETLRTSLESSGLITPTSMIKIQEGSMSDVDQRAIFLYLKDSLKKYEVFKDLERKISLFTDILNRKFDGSKSIKFSRDNGIEVFTRNGEKLNPRLLSSGEQHEIILLYDLIFKASKNMLVLIDEPEISLHIDWQLEFIPDLEAISKLNNPQFLIATHSPTIIGNRISIAQEIEQ